MLTFYDSGIGGLTVAKEYMKLKPQAEFKYYADFDILPMGDKSKQQILDQVKLVATKVFVDSSLLVLACNTASVNTVRELQQFWLPKNFPDKQILSISKPITELLESKYSKYKDQNLVILATKSTIDSGFYQQEFEQIGFVNITGVGCVGLCDLIEELVEECSPFQPFQQFHKSSQFLKADFIHNTINSIDKINQNDPKITKYLKDLQLTNNSLILLACTHYPIIKDIIKSIYPNCIVIDPSQFIAQKLIEYQKRHTMY
jgi:glutamate racemase